MTLATQTILVIDDNTDNLRVAVEHLEHAGYETRTARSGESGLKRAAAAGVGLILLDVTMPGWDGFETCRRLKADPAVAHIPVIFMTALQAVEMKVEALAVGGVDYVTKPFESAELIARVRTHLKIAALQEVLALRNGELADLNATLASRVAQQTRTIRARAEEVEQLNAQLRTQVQERSLALGRALRRLTTRRGDDDTLEGKLLDDRYRVEAPLARGGMGAVYTGLDEQTGQKVAIKVIHQGMASPQLVGRFLREAQLAASVAHPAVARMLHVDIHDDGMLYQVQELVAGEPLDAALQRHHRMGPGQAARFLSVLASALQAAHAAGVAHRDLKPANVILTATAPGLKLVDFGIAKLSDADETGATTPMDADTDLTRPGMVVGTPRFMSPEQRAGMASGPPSDIYSLGVLTHLLVTGAHPSKGWKMRPGPLERLVRESMALDWEQRPTADRFAREAAAYADRERAPELEKIVAADRLQ